MNNPDVPENSEAEMRPLQQEVVPRYATNTESTVLAIAHTLAFWLVATYDWKLGLAYMLHTLCSIWRSPMIWKRHNE